MSVTAAGAVASQYVHDVVRELRFPRRPPTVDDLDLVDEAEYRVLGGLFGRIGNRSRVLEKFVLREKPGRVKEETEGMGDNHDASDGLDLGVQSLDSLDASVKRG
jgi:hypothetical protein